MTLLSIAKAVAMNEPLSPAAVIFDFDGVIADSEALANTVLAEAITELGLPTTLDDALLLYQGKRWHEVIALIEEGTGLPLPADFADNLKINTLRRLGTDLVEVKGAIAFIRKLQIPKCIASSSSIERLTICLHTLGIYGEFNGLVFSADAVPHGKPAPDIFLHAASQLRVAPAGCVVIEDSASGVQAGVGAGMTVIGLCAASHCKAGHKERLAAAGAAHVVDSWLGVSDLIATR